MKKEGDFRHEVTHFIVEGTKILLKQPNFCTAGTKMFEKLQRLENLKTFRKWDVY